MSTPYLTNAQGKDLATMTLNGHTVTATSFGEIVYDGKVILRITLPNREPAKKVSMFHYPISDIQNLKSVGTFQKTAVGVQLTYDNENYYLVQTLAIPQGKVPDVEKRLKKC